MSIERDDTIQPTTKLGVGEVPTADLRPARMRIATIEIPGYTVTDLLGEGGMGTVYAAEQDNPHRRVAIKVLEGRSQSAFIRFQNEAEIMARLDHPGIARVLEAGEADGRPFLVMEHVDGTTLDRYVKELGLRARLELFVALCEAVQHAHIKGVIHRDLKPANVMVRSDGRVVVLDFGVARLAVDDGSMTPTATRAGELIGTPIYMSPEQARLRPDEVDARTDVYTLGVMLYELCSNELPYETRDAPLPILTCMICEDPATPLAKRDPALRGDLDAITGKALAKEPGERYQSIAALGDDVRRHLDKLPVSVRSPGAIERTARFVRRRPYLASAIGVAVAAAAAFAIVVTILWREAAVARIVAEGATAQSEVRRAALETRTNQLTLRTARAALARDPTEALAYLATLTSRGVDAGTAWAIADEALARGVAKDVLRGHSDEVHRMAELPGGFVSAGYDGKVIVWDPAPRTVFTAKKGRAHVAVPSPDGSEIAVGGDFGGLDVVSRDGKHLASLPGYAGDVQHVAWSADGAWLAAGDDHGRLAVWPKGRAPCVELIPGGSTIGTVAFAPTGELASGDHAGVVRWYDLATHASASAATGTDIATVWTDGKRVISADAGGTVRTFRVDRTAPPSGGAAGPGQAGTVEGTPPALVADHVKATGVNVKRAVFGPAGAWLVLGGVGGTVTRVVLDAGQAGAVDGDTLEPIGLHHSQVRSIAISEDGRWIAHGGDDGTLALYDRISRRTRELAGHTGRIRHLLFVDGGKQLLSSDSDGVVRRWDLTEMPPTELSAGGEAIDRLAISPDGATVATVDAAYGVSTWNTATGAHVALGTADSRVTALAFAGDRVVTGTTEGIVTLWGDPPHKESVHAIVKAIATSSDRIAVATSAGPIAMFSVAGGALPSLAGNPAGTEAIAFAPSGDLLASGGQDRSVRVWRRTTDAWTQVAALDGPKGDTTFVAFSPGGDLLASAGNDGVVYAWRVTNGAVDPGSRMIVARHTGAVTALAVTAGWIASAGRDVVITRAKVSAGSVGASETATIPAAATRLVLEDDGDLRAVTRAGGVIRWSLGSPAVVESEHGARDAVRLADHGRWLEAFDDGALVAGSLHARSLAELRATLARATTYTLTAR